MGIPRLLLFGRDDGRLGVSAYIGDWRDVVGRFGIGHIEVRSWA